MGSALHRREPLATRLDSSMSTAAEITSVVVLASTTDQLIQKKLLRSYPEVLD